MARVRPAAQPAQGSRLRGPRYPRRYRAGVRPHTSSVPPGVDKPRVLSQEHLDRVARIEYNRKENVERHMSHPSFFMSRKPLVHMMVCDGRRKKLEFFSSPITNHHVGILWGGVLFDKL